MKPTLLDMVQDVLSSMNSDEVNSIGDTSESMQVARLVRTVYFNILARANLPEHQGLFSLTASNNTDLPVIMYRPDNVTRIDWIKYNVTEGSITDEPDYRYITILPHEQFLDMTQSLSPDEDGVETFTLDDNVYFYRTDRDPVYCTIIKDYQIIFDGYNSDLDATLQESKTLCSGLTAPVFYLEDSFTPDLDENIFPLLLNEVKSLAFLELKQMPHELAAQESRRQWRVVQKNKQLSSRPNLYDLPDFGRRQRAPLRSFR